MNNSCANCEHGEIYFDQTHYICELNFALHDEDFCCENHNQRED